MPWVGGLYRKGNFATNGWTGDAANNIGIEAGRHDTQDDDFATGINQCLNKDGSNQATGNLNFGGSYKLTNLAPGTASTDSATYGQVLTAATSATTPVGSIIMFGGAAAPTGFLLCDGSSRATASFASLFAVIGYTYGGSGANFNLPDLRQRFPLGKAAAGTGSTLGGTGGAIDHVHTVKKHYHSVTGGTAAKRLNVDIAHTHAASGVTGTVGGTDGTHTHTITDPGHGHANSLIWQLNVNFASSPKVPNTFPFFTYSETTNSPFMSSAGAVQITNNTTGITGTTSTNSGHGHGHSLTAAGQTLGSTSVGLAGYVGPLTTDAGVVDGNIDQDTTTSNPPFLVVNYIIKT